MTTFTSLLINPELLYLQLADPSVTYTDMKNFCDGSTETRRICARPRFVDLLREKKTNVLLQIRYPDLLTMCDAFAEVQQVCTSDEFWERKVLRDFEARLHVYNITARRERGDSWKDIYVFLMWMLRVDLIEAVYEQNIADVRRLVAFGVDVNLSTDGDYPLRAAAYTGNTEMVRVLMKNGADPFLPKLQIALRHAAFRHPEIEALIYHSS
uniref:Ankyrin repeat protein n=1 Tax=Pithovirus LCPAC304 TaxID=2506594 RepID=A0A481ZAM8_9VIRU|nr:MAG: ankyrin repeat protein [Pithovirus LCPAC304]